MQSNDVKKLAELARLEISDDEAERVAGDLSKILSYVKAVSEVQGAALVMNFTRYNVMRSDEVLHESNSFSADLLTDAPAVDNDYVVVQKILS